MLQRTKKSETHEIVHIETPYYHCFKLFHTDYYQYYAGPKKYGITRRTHPC